MENAPEQSAAGDEAVSGEVYLQAHASGGASVVQSGRDTHIHHHDGVNQVRRTDGSVVEECPYPGLAAFGEQHARWFFGRERITAQLATRLAGCLPGGGPLFVVAPSGAGKSSLLRAGLLPALDRGVLPAAGSRHWPRVVLTPTAHPVLELASKLAALLAGTPEVAEQRNADPGLSGWSGRVDGLMDLVREVLTSFGADRGGARAQVVVVVDQFEEVFTLCADEEERSAFIDLLFRIAQPEDGSAAAGLVVVGLRADFYAQCANHPRLRSALEDDQILLGPMSETEVRETILYPAREVGLEIEPGLVELLVRDLGIIHGGDGGGGVYEAGRLPLLAHALRATWQQRHGHTLTVDGYNTTGGIENAVATSAEQVFTRLDQAGRQSTRTVFLALVEVGDGAGDTRRRMPRESLPGSDPARPDGGAVIDAFAEARLLTLEHDAVVITHEVLLRAWPRLRNWIREDHEWLLARQSLDQAARTWIREGRHPTGLYQGPRLVAVRGAAAEHSEDLSAAAAEFLAAGTAREHADRAASRRRSRVLRTLSAALTLLLVVVTGVSLLVVQARRDDARETRDTVSQQLAALSTEGLNGQGASSYDDLDLRAVAGWQSAHTPQALGSLLSASVTGYAGTLPDTGTDPAAALAATSDGSLVAAGDECAPPTLAGCGTLRVWDTATRDEVIQQPYPSIVTALAFSPNGRMLAVTTYGRQFQVQVWDTRTRRASFTLGTGPATGVAFSPDGTTIAAAGLRGVTLWNVADRTATNLPFPTGSPSFKSPVAFSPDGRLIAAAVSNGAVYLWSTSSHRLVGVLPGQTGEVSAIAFSPDGRTLAVASAAAGTAQLWNVADRTLTATLQSPAGSTGVINTLAFNPAGNYLVTADGGNIYTWASGTGAYTAQLSLDGSAGNLFGFAYGGNMIFSSYNNGDVVVENFDFLVASLSQSITSAAINPRNGLVATGDDEGNIRLWDPQTRKQVRILSSGAQVESLAFSPDGISLTAATFGTGQNGQNSQVIVYNPATGAREHTLPLPDSPWTFAGQLSYTGDGRFLVLSVGPTFAPGSTLKTDTADTSIEVWDTATWRKVLTIPLSSPLTAPLVIATASAGTELAVGSPGDIELWDLATGVRTAQWSTGSEHPTQLAFVPGTGTLLAGNQDGTITEWNTASHTIIRTFPATPSSIRTLGVSPDGSTVAVGGQDLFIHLYSLSTGTLIASLQGHLQYVTALVFSADGTHLLSASIDGTALWWNLDPAQAVQTLCQAVRGPSLDSSWQQLSTEVGTSIGPPPC
jgi:WD40 repeat protein